MRLVFIATGDIALPSFRRLLEHGPRPLALVTQPDRPVGRRQTLTPPAIKVEAIAADIPVYQPERIGDCSGRLAALEPDVLVVMAYGQILRRNILDLPGKAIINLHASLLPKYRGAACIQAAIDAGDPATGITAMHVIRELDAGDIIHSQSIDIRPDETGGSLHDRLADLAPEVLVATLNMIANGSAPRVPQDPALASYVPKLDRDDGRIDWNLPAEQLERRIRAFDPWPGTFAIVIDEAGVQKRVKIFPPTRAVAARLEPGQVECADQRLLIGCGVGALEPTWLQAEGGRKLSAAEFIRGRRPGRFD